MNSIFSIRNLTLRDMIQSEEYQAYEADRLRNYLAFSNPKLYGRIMEYAETGGNGRTHGEVIEGWRDYLKTVRLPERVRDRLEAEIDETEEWHINNKSIDTIIN